MNEEREAIFDWKDMNEEEECVDYERMREMER